MSKVKATNKHPKKLTVGVGGKNIKFGESEIVERGSIGKQMIDGEILEITELTEDDVAKVGSLKESIIAKIKADKELLNPETDFTDGGVPKCGRLEEIGEDGDVSAEMRNEIWEAVKPLYPDAK